LVGILKVPALGLVAPVEEGTKDQELNVAVGHVATSVYPGQPGAAVLLAHDVSYFVHIGQLHPPDRLIFETPCTTSVFRVTGNRVVAEGSPIPGSKTPSLVLDTCYPENALFYTSTRLLVDATKTGTSPHPLSHPIEASTTKGHVQENSLEYSTPVPAALEAEGLTLQQNEVPMGTMSMATSPTPHWDESPGPLDLEAQSLSIYFGGIHALRQDQIAWWNALSKTHVAAPKELISAESVEDLSPLNVQIRSRHRIAVQVVFSVEVHINGGQAPGRYAEAVSLLVTKQSVRLQGWLFAPLT
jgi:LPXTG-site transpeptidase (sortase) family protein